MSTPWLSSSSSGASSMALLSSPTVWNTQKENVVSAFFSKGGTDHGKGKRDGKMIKVEPKKSFCQITDGFPSHFSGVFFLLFREYLHLWFLNDHLAKWRVWLVVSVPPVPRPVFHRSMENKGKWTRAFVLRELGANFQRNQTAGYRSYRQTDGL